MLAHATSSAPRPQKYARGSDGDPPQVWYPPSFSVQTPGKSTSTCFGPGASSSASTYMSPRELGSVRYSAHVGPLHAGTASGATDPSHIRIGTSGASPAVRVVSEVLEMAISSASRTASRAIAPAQRTYSSGASYASSFSTCVSTIGPPTGARNSAS